ncbi:hypothetical protein F4802DRAFT_29809 [Xylaria palmicola]|nr:hypothetical protein F4802DRAFT_29809 [Xylaria palmicola]
MAEVAPAMLSGLAGSVDDGSRKSSKHSKKRQRDANAEKSERKHKKSKSDAAPASSQVTEAVADDSAPKQKRKDRKSSKTTDLRINSDDGGEEDKGGRKKTYKKESKKSRKRDREPRNEVPDVGGDSDDDMQDAGGHPDVVVLASARSKTLPDATKSEHRYPFYTQTVSQYLPLHPLGINEPIEGYINQHLEPLLSRYVPSFGGVLLAYRNPRIGEAPGSSSLTQNSGMEDTAVLESINEHAVSFCWLTVEIDIFQPSRGSWLEGRVNIQSGGHIGAVCWGKFNASIEAGRLPRDWRWVDQHPNQKTAAANETTSSSSSPEDGAEADHTEVHVTGYWVDGQGSKVTADTPIHFRIKNYEVGTSGDYGYLSIEGTMLTEDEEEKKARDELELLKHKEKNGSVLRRERRSLLEVGMTKFGDDDARESESQRTEA